MNKIKVFNYYVAIARTANLHSIIYHFPSPTEQKENPSGYQSKHPLLSEPDASPVPSLALCLEGAEDKYSANNRVQYVNRKIIIRLK